jgi:uncharacterized protein YukE
MDDEIKIGEALLDYVTRVSSISGTLLEAYVAAAASESAVKENYTGKANNEITAYYFGLKEHIARLINFFETAGSYISMTYMEMYRNDEQLAAWIANQLEALD